MIKQIILVKTIIVPTDPQTEVYTVEIVPMDPNVIGVWHEVFNTQDRLMAFLRGLRVATSQLHNTFDMNQAWVFDKNSTIENLP